MVLNSPCLTDKKELIHHEGTALFNKATKTSHYMVLEGVLMNNHDAAFSRHSANMYVVPTGRVVVPTGRYVVPTGRVVVPTGRYVVPAGREVGSIRHIQGLDMTYWGFIGVGTTFDIF
ncbi:hypothetical protein Tco_0090458 [Tanacetum coccineum]